MSRASFTFKVELPRDLKPVIEREAKELAGGVNELIMYCIDHRKEAARRCEQKADFEKFRDSLDWIREYSGEYGNEVLAFGRNDFDQDILFTTGGAQDERAPVTLAESIEWMIMYEVTGKLGIESEDHTENFLRWLRLVASQLRAKDGFPLSEQALRSATCAARLAGVPVAFVINLLVENESRVASASHIQIKFIRDAYALHGGTVAATAPPLDALKKKQKANERREEREFNRTGKLPAGRGSL